MLQRTWSRWMRALEAELADRVRERAVFWWLTAITALENTVIPLTVEPVVLPLMAIYRERAWTLAAAMTVGSWLGGLVMYAAGAGLAGALGDVLAGPSLSGAETFGERLEQWGWLAVVVFAVTPLPLQAATVGAGLAGYPLPLFALALLVGRGALYATMAALALLFGRAFPRFVDRHKSALMTLGIVAGIAAVVLVPLLGAH